VGITNFGRVQDIYHAELIRVAGSRAGFACQNNNLVPIGRHAVTRSRRGRGTHVLESVPSLGSDAERRQIAQVSAFLGPATKNVHDIVDQCCRMAFSRRGDVPDAVLLSPRIGGRGVRPHVVEPVGSIGTSKPASVQR
jgi:hypothetical protein